MIGKNYFLLRVGVIGGTAVPSHNRAQRSLLAAEVGKKPEEEREGGAEEEAGDDGKVKGGVLAAMHDVARETAKAQRELPTEI
jgi:hypothetical protein